ncbi:Protein CHROMATIN REMODELING 20 [Tolypocladium paradoxum]|uniref:Protein CHROMATIN REMODELING 20 n=1 Tax=Tolypocladium paradoxum TaxID=94208 RepID=A0A2S4KX45_9HYPO|nr:Protein CHROMATIN REMODELING 20 [Tolypocladium paradoxum]
MEGVRHHDPFLWDVEAVSEKLCSLDRPCTRDPAALAAKIREEEMDGHALLTFEFVCSRQELFESLNIRLAGHKAALGRALVSLRSKSPAFRQWKIEFAKEQSEDTADLPDTDLHGRTTGLQHAHATNSENSNGSASQQLEDDQTADLKRKLDVLQGESRVAQMPESSTPAKSQEISISKAHGDSAETGPDGAKSAKRMRVAPTQLSSKVVNSLPLPIATEADGVNNAAALDDDDEGGFPWERAAPQAYLGKGVIAMAAIKSSDDVLTTQIQEDEEGAFATTFPVRLPAGWRLIANRAMRRLLVKNGHTEALLAQGLVAMRSPTPSEEGDEIFELFDLPDSLDEETLREIEAERADMENAATQQQFVTRERVEEVLQNAIDDHKTKWEESKLPRHQRKAHKIWTDARKKGTRNKQVLQARHRAKMYDDRIKKLSAEILGETWAKESEVRLQARCLEQSLEDKFHNVWLADMLESRVEPPKPASVLVPQRPAVRRPQSPTGSEVLTSSDEDDLVVPDDEDETMGNGDLLAVDDDASVYQPSPMKVESPMYEYMDLTQVETPEELPREHRHVSVIDLTTPVKPGSNVQGLSTPNDKASSTAVDAASPAEESFDVEQIGKQPPSHWAKLGDRSRLLICVLWKLGHTRRTWVFEAARDASLPELYELSVRQQLKSGVKDVAELQTPGPRTMAFDITRLFLCYIKVKHCKESRIATPNGKDRERLVNGKSSHWSEFYDFVNKIAPDFPVESQILRTDAFDDDLGDLGDLDDAEDDDALPGTQDTPSRSRKNAPREIIQNKEAVDLRERERLRLEEQEARRLKLRAAFDTSGSMPRDKFRLIINEAKQDDQPFIYINEETGKRIKDHQIDGVRFIWNQIILDSDVRQGCLLAHTMGLGKTMQVITFLVAIQEAVKSADPSVTAQIPKDLRESKALVLCPAGLVDNWMDELLLWTPGGLLGALRKVESQMPRDERRLAVQSWADEGGILVVGYKMLQKVLQDDEDLEETLINGPNIVIADEAHVLKSPSAKVHLVCSRFKANCRIALTGSPLANNVEEYYSMIDWVAPNYLGPLGEFRDIYATPIQQGLWGDSMGFEKRRALKMLQVLKETVAPKVHRATIKSCLKEDLPPKHEFVLCIPPTRMQQRLYEVYVSGIQGEYQGTKKLPQTRVFSIVNDLLLLCNHPRCFRQKVLGVRQKALEVRQGRDGEEGKPPYLPETLISASLKETNAHDLDNPALSGKAELLLLVLDEARRVHDKVLVFSQSLPTLDYLLNLLKMQKRRVCRLDGSTQIGKRQDMIKNFNVDDQEVYLISTNAGGVGLNIQGANRVVIFDFKWNPVQEQQAIGRAYRIGQEKTVFVYRFVVAGTFEEDLQNKAVFKMQLASRVVDKKNPVSWSKRLGSLLHSINPVRAKSLEEFAGKDVILDKLINYKNNGEAIRYIVSTDTFEEEDLTVNLTAEERRDAEDMVKLNRLRVTDPKEYERQREEEQKLLYQQRVNVVHQYNQSQLQQIQAAPSVPPTQGEPYALPNRTTDGASDEPGSSFATANRPLVSSLMPQLQTAAAVSQVAGTYSSSQGNSVPRQTSTAPLPRAGANTYFGKETQPDAPSTPNARSTQPVPTTPVATSLSATSIFSPPRRSQAKDAFERSLSSTVEFLQHARWPGVAGDRQMIARNIAAAIDKVRKDSAYGFVLDDHHWRLLDEFLTHEKRFALATVAGHFTASYLALANKQELQRRVAVLNSLSQPAFEAQLASGMKAPDPENANDESKNLRNIQRSSAHVEIRSRHAIEDMAVMRQAADKRRQRSIELPTWANRALEGGRDGYNRG